MTNDDEERYLRYRLDRASWMYRDKYDPELREGIRSFMWFAFEKGNTVFMELVNFSNHYFDSRKPNLPRNVVNIVEMEPSLSVFRVPGEGERNPKLKPLGLTEKEIAQTYILLNTREVQPYVSMYEELQLLADPSMDKLVLEQKKQSDFMTWFKETVAFDTSVDINLRNLAFGPSNFVLTYKTYTVNGYKFQIDEINHLATKNSGVMVTGSCSGAAVEDWYGRVVEIIELDFPGVNNKVVLFNCQWFDSKGIVRDKHGIVRVNMKLTLKTKETYVLASQAKQIYYARSVKPSPTGGCHFVIVTKARAMVEVAQNQCTSDETTFQEDQINNDRQIFYNENEDINVRDLADRNDTIEAELDVSNIGNEDIDMNDVPVQDASDDEGQQFNDDNFSDGYETSD